MNLANGKKENSFSKKIGDKEERKLKAQRDPKHSVWFGLGMFGLVGWSVVIPTLLGTALGIWLDKKYPASFSWTLTMLVVGLFLGCVIAWNWISKEHKDIHHDHNHVNKNE